MTGTLTITPASILSDRFSVVAGRQLLITVKSGDIPAKATGTIAASRAGREIWNAPLKYAADTWSVRAALPEAGPYIFSVRLFEGAKVWSSAVDLSAKAIGSDNRSERAEMTLDFNVSGGKGGFDPSGNWGTAAMVLLALIVVGISTQGMRKKKI
jgi:hypothetical protein